MGVEVGHRQVDRGGARSFKESLESLRPACGMAALRVTHSRHRIPRHDNPSPLVAFHRKCTSRSAYAFQCFVKARKSRYNTAREEMRRELLLDSHSTKKKNASSLEKQTKRKACASAPRLPPRLAVSSRDSKTGRQMRPLSIDHTFGPPLPRRVRSDRAKTPGGPHPSAACAVPAAHPSHETPRRPQSRTRRSGSCRGAAVPWRAAALRP